MLPAAVLLVFVLASSPLASSHSKGHELKRHYPHRPHKPWMQHLWGQCKHKKDACCKKECPEDYHCRVQEFSRNAAACFPNNPCEELKCGTDLPCVLPPDGSPCCGSLCCAVTCPPDNHCRIDEISAAPACFPNDPCKEACAPDQPCVVPPGGTAYCYSPPLDPCSKQKCLEGSKCFVVDDEATCLSGCTLGGADFEHGQVINDTAIPQCQDLKCSDGRMKTVFDVVKGTACTAPFTQTTQGCFYYEPNANKQPWCAARQMCIAKGGDLATIDYDGIRDFMQSITTTLDSYPAWVGARGPTWLAGMEIQQANRGPGKPDALKSCVSIEESGTLLVDDNCDTPRPYFCQLF